MGKTVEVTIPVEPEAAALLHDARKREAVGRVISRMLQPNAGLQSLVDAIERLKADAHARGLTDEAVDQELAAFNTERRS